MGLQVIEIVCCRLSPLQEILYQHFLASKAAKVSFLVPPNCALVRACKEVMLSEWLGAPRPRKSPHFPPQMALRGGNQLKVLAAITALKKLVNHPKVTDGRLRVMCSSARFCCASCARFDRAPLPASSSFSSSGMS